VLGIEKCSLCDTAPHNMHIPLCKGHITLPPCTDSRQIGDHTGEFPVRDTLSSCRALFLSDSVAAESIPSKRYPYPVLTSRITVTNPRKAKVKVYFITCLVRFLSLITQVHHLLFLATGATMFRDKFWLHSSKATPSRVEFHPSKPKGRFIYKYYLPLHLQNPNFPYKHVSYCKI
jgi:hypothetical protein